MAKKSATKEKSAPKEKPERITRPKAKSDAYTMMLFITLASLILGCVMMQMDWDEYGQKNPGKESPPTLPKLGEGGTAAPVGGGGGGNTPMPGGM